ncbi:ankyrin repeat-containing domain protein [Aspergillus pseudoustus]|uniref:Ankyrin repeat-containing domain protein n=1 Tax=Aspergillus pseudoustus TaxID=1810923 RepID=A0ABR4J649_9EURO
MTGGEPKIAWRREDVVKALEKQAAPEQTPTVHTGIHAGPQDYTELSLPARTTIDLNSVGFFPPLPASDLVVLGGGFPAWDDSTSGLAGSNVSVSPPTDLLRPTHLMSSVLAPTLESPEAVRQAAMAFLHTVVPRPNPVFSNNRNETLIHTAARGNDVATLQLLVQHGFPLNERDNEGRTALHAAYEEHHMEAISWLLEHGADVNAVDKEGRSTLSMAVNNKCPVAVKLFLAHGASFLPRSLSMSGIF